MVDPPVLVGSHVRLEPLETRHIPGLAAASGEDPALYRWSTVPVGEAETAAYVEHALQGAAEGHMRPFAIVALDSERVVGCTRYCDIQHWDWPAGHSEHGRTTPDVCEIGYTWLAGSAQRTGVNTDAKRLLLAFAFETWRVHRVCLLTDARNQQSRRAIERLGALPDGVIRAHRPGTDGAVRDSALYSIVASEWPAVKERLAALAR